MIWSNWLADCATNCAAPRDKRMPRPAGWVRCHSLAGRRGESAPHVYRCRVGVRRPRAGADCARPRGTTPLAPGVGAAVSAGSRGLFAGPGRTLDQAEFATLVFLSGRLAQRESTAFTRQGSLVQIQYRPPSVSNGFGPLSPSISDTGPRSVQGHNKRMMIFQGICSVN